LLVGGLGLGEPAPLLGNPAELIVDTRLLIAILEGDVYLERFAEGGVRLL
jgi:hypothetical protein